MDMFSKTSPYEVSIVDTFVGNTLERIWNQLNLDGYKVPQNANGDTNEAHYISPLEVKQRMIQYKIVVGNILSITDRVISYRDNYRPLATTLAYPGHRWHKRLYLT